MQVPDLERLMLGAIIIRANIHAADALNKSGDQQLGLSRGGFGAKIHEASDGLGKPVKSLLTSVQTHDITKAVPLLEGLPARHVIADKGQGSASDPRTRGRCGHSPKSNRKVQHPYGKRIYKKRNQTERLFARFKKCGRLATRYDKTARNFLPFTHLLATMTLLP